MVMGEGTLALQFPNQITLRFLRPLLLSGGLIEIS